MEQMLLSMLMLHTLPEALRSEEVRKGSLFQNRADPNQDRNVSIPKNVKKWKVKVTPGNNERVFFVVIKWKRCIEYFSLIY